jgi:hypothetical protein
VHLFRDISTLKPCFEIAARNNKVHDVSASTKDFIGAEENSRKRRTANRLRLSIALAPCSIDA